MKIDSISNSGFSPVSQSSQARAAKVAAPEQKSQAAGGAALSHNGLTSAEHAFFAKLFPEISSQKNAHATYSPNGVHSSVETGQIINRKV
jgi:hypothetical protein